MNELLITFMERYTEWKQALFEHLQISLVALLIAVFIAVPLGILIAKHKKIAELMLQMIGIVQTIPSLAILGLLIPLIGIGVLPAVFTLILYGIFPIFQNTLTAFWELDAKLEEAADAFGMNRLEKLKKYQLALTMPIIVSGIRTSAILIIGTATLAALIGAGGLGSFILLGIDRHHSALILIGALSSAMLAIGIGAMLKYLEKKSPRFILITFMMLFAVLTGSFFKQNMMSFNQHTITIAGKLGAEPEILMNMYKVLIEQDTDIEVVLKPNFGKTSFLYESLKNGDIDIYPEFSGTITNSLLSEPLEQSHDATVVYEQAREGIYAQDKLVYLKPMGYQNTYALALNKEYAKTHQLYRISDLKKVEHSLIAGFSLEFNDREDGNKGLKQIYQLDLNVNTLESALRYEAMRQNNVNVIDVYSTDSQLIVHQLQVLEDDLNLFPPYQAAPLLREETLIKYPQLKPILNQLADVITDEQMRQMNYQVDVEKKSAFQVATHYLATKGLLKQRQ